jgi:hypothetical protein
VLLRDGSSRIPLTALLGRRLRHRQHLVGQQFDLSKLTVHSLVKELTHLVDRSLQQMRMLRSPQADSFPPRVVQAEMVGMSSLTIKDDSSMCGTTMVEGLTKVLIVI